MQQKLHVLNALADLVLLDRDITFQSRYALALNITTNRDSGHFDRHLHNYLELITPYPNSVDEQMSRDVQLLGHAARDQKRLFEDELNLFPAHMQPLIAAASKTKSPA